MNYQKIITLFAMFGVFTQLAAKSINVSDISICPGETREFYIFMNTARDNLVSFQIDLKLPKGLTLNVDKCKLPTRILGRNPETKMFVGCLDETDNIYRLVTANYDNLKTGFSQEDAPLVIVSITASEDFQGGKVTLQDMIAVNYNAEGIKWAGGDFNITSVPHIQFDHDRNGAVTVNDVMTVVSYVLEGESLYSSNYDVDVDGSIDVKDVEMTVSSVLGR